MDSLAQVVGQIPEVVQHEAELARIGVYVRRNMFAVNATEEVSFDGKTWKNLSDDELAVIRVMLGLKKHAGLDVLKLVAIKNGYNPVQDYLNSVKWDGEPRVRQFFHKYFGAPDTPLNEEVSELFLRAAVRRAFKPGCKFDYCVTLQGPEKIGKSETIRALVPDEALYTDSLEIGASAKVTGEQTNGIWVVELAELAGNLEHKQEEIKAFISRQIDGPFRAAYAEKPTTAPRKFVMLATTNNNMPLKSDEGNRRFWIVKVTGGERLLLEHDRNQIWAEAVHLERTKGDTQTLTLSRDVNVEMTKLQAENYNEEPWAEIIKAKLEQLEGKRPDKTIRSTDLFDLLGISKERRTKRETARLNRIMTNQLGFRRDRTMEGGVYFYAYSRKTETTPNPNNGPITPETREYRRLRDEFNHFEYVLSDPEDDLPAEVRAKIEGKQVLIDRQMCALVATGQVDLSDEATHDPDLDD